MLNHKIFLLFNAFLIALNVFHCATKPYVDLLEPQMPFPNHVLYLGKTIKPSNKTLDELNQSVKDMYDYWKAKYVKDFRPIAGSYYVQYVDKCEERITVSEAHGYAMLILAFMAGYDPEAKVYFDGFLRVFDQFRSIGNPELMDWDINCALSLWPDANSATDGDLDIAYALLLAHKQWGSEGKMNYLDKALSLIQKGIKKSNIHPVSFNIMLGDWDRNEFSSRSSDWMLGHFKTFYQYTKDDIWLKVTDKIYANIAQIQENYSPDTGLMPDFIDGDPMVPAKPQFLEGPYDGNYYYNACRWPLRMAIDAAQFLDKRSIEALAKVNNWLVAESEADPNKVMGGYYLDGNVIGDWHDGAYQAPFTAGLTLESKYQDALNNFWEEISGLRQNYYSDHLNLLSQIFISGNWWNP